MFKYNQVCSNDDPGLTMTYFTARSNLVPYAFVWEKDKTMDFFFFFFRNYCTASFKKLYPYVICKKSFPFLITNVVKKINCWNVIIVIYKIESNGKTAQIELPMTDKYVHKFDITNIRNVPL